MSFNVAVVGATGVVGRAMRSILEDRNFPVKELRLMRKISATSSLWRGTGAAGFNRLSFSCSSPAAAPRGW